MRNDDSFRLISIETAGQFLAAFGFLICLYFMVGSLDYADELTAEAQAKLDRAEAIRNAAESAAFMASPIPWDAVVQQSGHGIEKAKPRLYVKASSREESK